MTLERQDYLRQLPSVDEILKELESQVREYPRQMVVGAIRQALEHARRSILESLEPGETPLPAKSEMFERVTRDAMREVMLAGRPKLRRVINATGVVLHTNLGRAILSDEARQAVQDAAANYTNLEFDLATGKRGSRYFLVEELLSQLTGAEAAMVVNNNAAAVLLALGTLAKGKEVIVSRGQLVEIGGSFRIPEVMAQSGARLVEVGATNKTYVSDYRRAITLDTALLLHVHTSNYRIVGFTKETSVRELVELGRETGLPVMSDLGSGFLVDLGRFGLPYEPTVQETVKAGADVVTFSGDKLLGGPQAGIIVGSRAIVAQMKKNPLTRAIRPDKLTLAGLEATLRAYLDPDRALQSVPALRMLTSRREDLQDRARLLLKELGSAVNELAKIQIAPDFSQVGGGSMPTAELPTFVVSIQPYGFSADRLIILLREAEPPVIGRVQDDTLLLDVRTVTDDEIPELAAAVRTALTKGGL
ncbi:MAG: L-seryl-tRNA(Sec) selenium transferase [Bacillota bacterium]|uniref:L-seryl-tRNA(Sec) selenium transferase n=1 Tax=Desulforudis sp. DRI-14 TaxID=3459793 RepID=UPI00346E5FB5